MTKVNLFEAEIKALGEDKDVINLLGQEAEKVKGRVRAPKHLVVYTRKGKSRRGAFAQIVMKGQGALAIEYGSRKNPPYAPLRRAMGGG